MGFFRKKTAEENPKDDEVLDEAALNGLATRLDDIEKFIVALGQQLNQDADETPPSQLDPTEQRRRFLSDIEERGEAAILENPVIMQALGDRLENRIRGLQDYSETRTGLQQKVPEAYTIGSTVEKTRTGIRDQFSKLGVHPSVLDSRMFEELTTYAAAGMHMDDLTKQRSDAQQVFVESGSRTKSVERGPQDLNGSQLSWAEKLGVKAEDYAKQLNSFVKSGVLEER